MTRKFSIVLVAALMLSACIQLGSAPPKQSHYLLEATDPMLHYSLEDGSTISIELIDFPEHLKRPQIVTRHQKNMIHFTDAHRWAHPLEVNMIRVIRDHLSFMMPGISVIVHPWETGQGSEHKIKMAVYRFSGTLDGMLEIDIRWQLITADGNKLAGNFSDNSAVGNNYPDLIDGLNRGLEKFCMELTKAIIQEITVPGS